VDLKICLKIQRSLTHETMCLGTHEHQVSKSALLLGGHLARVENLESLVFKVILRTTSVLSIWLSRNMFGEKEDSEDSPGLYFLNY
jgi:hypothetical protein